MGDGAGADDIATAGAALSPEPEPAAEPPDEPPSLPPSDPPAASTDADRAKWIVAGYSAFLVVLIPFFLWAGRGDWFEHDDWDYLVSRKAGNFGDLMRPHSGQWEAIPVLVYRFVWTVFGLRYRPYELVSILLSLVGAAILLVVLLRSRTRPWIAILVVTLLVFFGDAQANVALRVTSITFVGFAIPLGLLQLILADHDGPLDRRDRLGLAAGIACLLCSSVAVAMVFVVGAVMLVKRGWRIACFHVVPPAVVFAVWYAAIGHTDNSAGSPAHIQPLPEAVHFGWVLVTGTFESLTRTNGIGVVFVVALLVGLYLALRPAGAERRAEAVVPCAMLLGAFFFAVETGLGRAKLLHSGARAVRAGHYIDVVAYLALPAVALLAEELVRRWRLVVPVLAVVLLVAIPVNARVFVAHAHAEARGLTVFRNTVLLIPRLELAREVSRDVQPFKGIATPITIGWLRDAASDGKLPDRKHVSAASKALASLRISMVISATGSTACHPFRAPVVRRLRRGDFLRFRGGAINIGVIENGRSVIAATYTTTNTTSEWQAKNVARVLTLRFSPRSATHSGLMLCA